MIARVPPKQLPHRPGRPLKWDLNHQGGRFYEPGMERRRDAWLRFNAPAVALPAYIDYSTPTDSLCPSPDKQSSSRSSEPTLAEPLTLLQARAPRTLRPIAPASPVASFSRRGAQTKSSARPGWKGWAEVAGDYIPDGTNMISDIPIRTARTRSEHVASTVTAAKSRRRSSCRLSGLNA
jgi:hypothetical protein